MEYKASLSRDKDEKIKLPWRSVSAYKGTETGSGGETFISSNANET
jgi:hypothetical protein